MKKIQYHSNKFWLLENVPEEPKEPARHWTKTSEWEEYESKTLPAYRDALEACIAAKKEIVNPELIVDGGTHGLCFTKDGKQIRDGDIFPLPDNVEFERRWVNECRDVHGDCQLTGDEYRRGCQHRCKKEYEVIHLKLKQEIKFESNVGSDSWIKDKFLEVKEESQDELWRQAEHYINWSYQEVTPELKSKFTIQRNKPEQ